MHGGHRVKEAQSVCVECATAVTRGKIECLYCEFKQSHRGKKSKKVNKLKEGAKVPKPGKQAEEKH